MVLVITSFFFGLPIYYVCEPLETKILNIIIVYTCVAVMPFFQFSNKPDTG